MNKKYFLLIIVGLFLATRFFVFSFPYHQDEYKWATMVKDQRLNPHHPPLPSILYFINGKITGPDHLRLVPILLSLGVLLVAYFLARRLYGEKAARWTAILLLVNPYSWIASTQVDIDGAFLPLFSVLLVYFYYQIDWQSLKKTQNRKWYVLLALALILGFLSKLSFILIVAALVSEHFLTYRPPWKKIFSYLWIPVSVVAVVWGLVLLSNMFLSNVSGAQSFLINVGRFSDFNLLNRRYSQIFFLSVKTLIIASPLFVGAYVLLLLRGKAEIKKYRLWLIFVVYSLLFYYLVFDFSHGGTVERYLMFMIIPSALILGSLISELWGKFSRMDAWNEIHIGVWGVVLFLLLSVFNYRVLPLQPKTDYINAVRHLDFSFLIPITGGSGPNGFYVMAGMVLVFYLVALIAIVCFRFLKKSEWRQTAFKVFVLFGLVYNILISGEFALGWQFGNVPNITKKALTETVTNNAIPEVITYYDIGSYELRAVGKYRNRFYTDPMFTSNVGKFSNYSGRFLVVDFPMINKSSVYWKYFETCKMLHSWNDKKVNAYLFDCKEGNRGLFYEGVQL